MILVALTFWLAQQSPLETVAQKLAEQFVAEPSAPEELFHKEFLKDFPPARLATVLKQLHAQYGECTATEVVADDTPYAGVVYFVFADRTRIATTLWVEHAPPHFITGLRLDNPRPLRRSIDDAVEELRKLRGKTSLTLQRLTPSPLTVAELNSDQPMAIGSTFKLWILGTLLAREEARKPDSWNHVLRLEEDHLSIGSGILDTWKVGSPLTLHSLVTLMISRSDNTATDHLLHFLGRERVEAVASEMGANPKLTRPFLSTLEAFKLKASADVRKQYLEADLEERRKLLTGSVRALKRDALDFSTARPMYIDEIEWFASTEELCTAMDWLRKRTQDPALAVGRDILAINPGVRYRKEAWKFVGYKGGSEPGVLNLTLLLQSSSDRWYALSATWNDPKTPLEEGPFLDVIQDIVYLLQKQS